MATAGDTIFAEPSTITGSIGIFAVLPSFERALAEYGVRAHASLGLSPTTDVTSTDQSIIAKGDELLRKATDVLHELGGTELCGVLYCSLGKYPGPASKENRANSSNFSIH